MEGITRRTLLEGGAGIVLLAALGGGARALAGDADLLRPPGGQDDARFFGNCVRCNRCVGACPTRAIGYATVEDGVLNVRQPVMRFRIGWCDMCGGDPRCIAACPTGALAPFDPEADKIGVAVVDEANASFSACPATAAPRAWTPANGTPCALTSKGAWSWTKNAATAAARARTCASPARTAATRPPANVA